jgi:type VI secretion system secreted protein Hcp
MPVDMFLDFSAGPAKGPTPITVVGESQDKTYAKTVQVSTFDFGAQTNTTIGSLAGGASTGKAQFKPFKFTHSLDSASAPLFQALTTGSHFPTLKFYVRRSGTATAYAIYTLNLVFITDIETALATSDDVPEETIQMLVGAVQVSYQPGGVTGTPSGAPITSIWNQITNSSTLTVPGN